MLCNGVEKLSNFACNLGILCKKILLMPHGNDVKMYKIMTYHLSSSTNKNTTRPKKKKDPLKKKPKPTAP